MPLERLEYHPPVQIRESRLHKIGRLIATGGLSLSESSKPEYNENAVEVLESKGYDPVMVQGFVDLIQAGQAGEVAAAVLRGAFNDLIDRLNQLESDSPAN